MIITTKPVNWIIGYTYYYFIACFLFLFKILGHFPKVFENLNTKRSKRFITIVKNIQVHLIHYFQLLELSTSYIRKVIRPQIFRGTTFTAIIGFVMSVFQFQILIHPVLGQNKC